MAKHKTEHSPVSVQPPAVSAEAPSPSLSQEPRAAAPLASDLPYQLGTWHGLQQWRCRLCPWDTLAGEEALLAHVREVHEPPLRPPSPPLVLVADRWGRELQPIERTPVPPEEPAVRTGQEE